MTSVGRLITDFQTPQPWRGAPSVNTWTNTFPGGRRTLCCPGVDRMLLQLNVTQRVFKCLAIAYCTYRVAFVEDTAHNHRERDGCLGYTQWWATLRPTCQRTLFKKNAAEKEPCSLVVSGKFDLSR
jgi:hypothetical protein